MTITVPDHLWAELQEAETANNAVVERTKPTFSGGTCLTLEAANSSLRLLKAQVAFASAASPAGHPSLVLDEVIMELAEWANADPYSEKAKTLSEVVEHLRGKK